MKRNCPVCNVEYDAEPKRLKWGRQTTCSRKCSYVFRSDMVRKDRIDCVCGNCGKGLEKRVNFKKPKHGEVFCSRTCMYEARAKGITPGKVKGTPNSGVKITKEEKLANRRAYRKKKILTDPKYRLINTLRVRLHEYMNQRGYKKDRNTFKVIGCTPDELREHIEKQWEPWMNWGNYGKYKPDTYNYGWDVDHFIPTSSAKTKKEIYKLSHYTNLKPLCSRINRHVKKDTIPT